MVAGKVKVHMSYDRRAQSLSVMVRHVKDLVSEEYNYIVIIMMVW